jgi:hypothetical protein
LTTVFGDRVVSPLKEQAGQEGKFCARERKNAAEEKKMPRRAGENACPTGRKIT